MKAGRMSIRYGGLTLGGSLVNNAGGAIGKDKIGGKLGAEQFTLIQADSFAPFAEICMFMIIE